MLAESKSKVSSERLVTLGEQIYQTKSELKQLRALKDYPYGNSSSGYLNTDSNTIVTSKSNSNALQTIPNASSNVVSNTNSRNVYMMSMPTLGNKIRTGNESQYSSLLDGAKSKRSRMSKVNLPSLLSDKYNIMAKSQVLKTGVTTRVSPEISTFRDEIQIKGSNRKIDYNKFDSYKELKCNDITFIKEKISFVDTELNSSDVKFPQSYLDLSNTNLEKHINLIRKKTKIGLNLSKSKSLFKGRDVFNESIENIQVLDETYNKIKDSKQLQAYNYDYFVRRKYFENPIREKNTYNLLALSKFERLDSIDEDDNKGKNKVSSKFQSKKSTRDISRIKFEKEKEQQLLRKNNSHFKGIVMRVDRLKNFKITQPPKLHLEELKLKNMYINEQMDPNAKIITSITSRGDYQSERLLTHTDNNQYSVRD